MLSYKFSLARSARTFTPTPAPSPSATRPGKTALLGQNDAMLRYAVLCCAQNPQTQQGGKKQPGHRSVPPHVSGWQATRFFHSHVASHHLVAVQFTPTFQAPSSYHPAATELAIPHHQQCMTRRHVTPQVANAQPKPLLRLLCYAAHYTLKGM